jgi:hypothetical protein
MITVRARQDAEPSPTFRVGPMLHDYKLNGWSYPRSSVSLS